MPKRISFGAFSNHSTVKCGTKILVLEKYTPRKNHLWGVFYLGFDGPKQTLLGMFGDEGVENLDNILDHHLLGGHAPLIDGQANLFP